MNPNQTDLFGLCETSPDEILCLGQSVNHSHGKEVNAIDPTIALPTLTGIAHPLAEKIDCSFNSGVFAQALKIVKVVPIFKRGPRDEVSN